MKHGSLAGLAVGAVLAGSGGLVGGLLGGGLLGGATAPASAPAGPASGRPDDGPSGADEPAAVLLLNAAAQAGRELSYHGVQYVASWPDGPAVATGRSAVLQVRHDGSGTAGPAPGGTSGAAPGGAALALSTLSLDARLVPLLRAAYTLQIAPPGHCTGRTASVVEARRSDGTVAGRFWLDVETGLLLRREVFDARGTRRRSSAFVEVAMASHRDVGRAFLVPPPSTLVADYLPDEEPVADVPATLPGGFRLFATDVLHPAEGSSVQQLSYSDGLSTLSLFGQDGQLGATPPPHFRATEVGGRPAWVRHDDPERAVWSGGGRVWTLVSDAGPDAVRDALTALPRDAAPERGVRARLGRGLPRLGSVLNPFG